MYWIPRFAGNDSVGVWSYPGPPLQDLEHTIGHHHAAAVHADLRAHEDQAARRAHHARAGDQDVADLAGFDEMGVELHRRHELLAGDVAGGHAAGTVRERHHHAALDHAAAVVVLVLGRKCEFVLAVDLALPQWADQVHEARGLQDGPAVCFQPRGGLVGHVVHFLSGSCDLVSSGPDVV